MKRTTAALLLFLGLWLTGASGQQTPPNPPSVAGELLVKFRPGASQARRDAALTTRGARLVRRFAALDLHHVRVPEGQTLQAAVTALQADPDVEYAQPNYIRSTTQTGTPNDPRWLDNSLWGLRQIQADDMWSTYTTGDGSVVVADIDTGVNYLHPDLAANMWTNPGEIASNGVDDDGNGYVDDVHGINVITHSGNPMDDHGHGTHTAGTIAGVGNNGLGVVGVNWNAKIVACKFLNEQGSGSDAGAIECLNYIIALKNRGVNIRATNNSYGSTRSGFPQALKAAFDAAGAAGILNVCAAGNNGTNNDVTPFDPATLGSTSIVSVAASDYVDSRAWFSNYGMSVHLAAPGLDILSTYGANYGTLSGTSMAAPHVTGAALIVAQRNPNLSPEGIKGVLLSSVDVLPPWSGLTSTSGRLNLFRAAQPAETPQTLLTTQVPTLANYTEGTPYELGVRLRSDTSGRVTAIRYWRAPGDAGSHVGRIWSAGGVLLASVAFAGETASGWQQQALATPLAIAANTEYIVSVPTGPAGYLVATLNAFPLTNGHLQGLGSRYGPVGSFPSGASAHNYFRDVVFAADPAPPDTAPPTVSITQPTQGSTVSDSVEIAATASDDIGVTGVQFQVDGVNFGGEVASAPYSVVWDSTTAANGSHTFTAVARDAAGHQTPASVTVTVNNGTPAPSQRLLTTQVPALANYTDGTTYELGVRLISDTAGQITAIRYWKAPSDTGSHVGRIWNSGGQLLASVAFAGETGSGWQQQVLATPLPIAANTEYVVSVPTGPTGYLVATLNAFPLTNGHLQGLGSRYGPVGSFPSGSSVHNYFRDVLFIADTGPPDTVPPNVSITQPSQGSTVSGPVTIAATASDNVGVAGVQFKIDGLNLGGEVMSAPYSVVWDSTTAANGPHTLTAVARDGAGQQTLASVTVTVNNGTPSPSQTLLTTQVPALGNYTEGTPYELGVRLVSSTAGQITAIRYWKAPSDTGSHVGRVWSAGGQLLASAPFTGETSSGWQQQVLATPLAIAANTEYVVSVPTGPAGYLVATLNAFPLTNGQLQGLGSRYGPAGSFPTGSSPHNYFRDVVFVPSGSAPSFAPAPVQASDLTLRVDFAGQAPTHHNLTSAVVAGSQLLLVDQGGYVYRWDGVAHNLLTPADFPAGIFPPGGESVLNVAANAAASSVFVMFSTFTAPTGIPVSVSPRPSDSWQVLYQYDFNGLALSNPRAIRAFQVRSDGHTGGGLVVLDDGSVVAAFGDSGDSGEDGRSFAQDPANHLAKILRVNPADGSTTVVAIGVRNVQRLAIDPNGGDPRLNFVDLGGFIAEEINSVRLADLLGAPSPLNFGWGRHAGDGNAREGTFYIDTNGGAIGAAPNPESGFVQPVAQFGREGAALIAVSGPVSGSPSFTTIEALFGDLPGGSVYALTGPLSQAGQAVFAVDLVDSSLQPVTLTGLAGGRPDPRFFMFPDGTAGVLLERTGTFYRLTQVAGLDDPSRRH